MTPKPSSLLYKKEPACSLKVQASRDRAVLLTCGEDVN